MLQRVGTRLCPAWRDIYYGLPGLIQNTRWIPELTEVLKEQGFENIRLEYLRIRHHDGKHTGLATRHINSPIPRRRTAALRLLRITSYREKAQPIHSFDRRSHQMS